MAVKLRYRIMGAIAALRDRIPRGVLTTAAVLMVVGIPLAFAGIFNYTSATFPLTGAETVPADTNLSGGRAPQTVKITTAQLQAFRRCDLTDGATITMSVATCTYGNVTLGGNRTLALSGTPQAAAIYRIKVTQDATGSRLMTWPAAFVWAGASAPTLTTTASRADMITCMYDGTLTKYLCDKQLNYNP